MKRLKNLKISTKLILGFGISLSFMLILVTISLVSLFSISKMMDATNHLRDKKLTPIYQIREALAQTGISARNAFIFKNEKEAQDELAMIDMQTSIFLGILKN